MKIRFNHFLDEISEEVIINNKKITLFIGSGFSVWYGYPSWDKLFIDFCDKTFSEKLEKKSYLEGMKDKVKAGYHIPKAFSEVIEELNLDGNYSKEFLIRYFSEIDRLNREKKFNFPGIDLEKYRLLLKLSKYCRVITTNFDTLIEDVFKNKFNIEPRIFYCDSNKLNKKFFLRDRNNYSILKLHGDVNRKETLIITEKDYEKIISNKDYRVIRQALKDNFASEINIFIGYSVSDENIKELLIENQEIYGDDKEKSYVINSHKLVEIFMREKGLSNNTNKYKELGIEEIYITGYDELFTILNHITNLMEIKENLQEEVSKNFSFQNISKNHNIWERVCLAISLYNAHMDTIAQKILGETIEEYDGDGETNWSYIYSLFGVILELSNDEETMVKGQEYISKAIKMSNDKDLVYYNIGNFYLASSNKKVYSSNISNNLGIITRANKKAVEKALYYFKLIEKATNVVNYKIFECVCRNESEEEVIEMGLKLLEQNIFEDTIYMEIGFKYYDLGYKLTNKQTEKDNKKMVEYFSKSIEFLENFINSSSFENESRHNKILVLDRCIKSLNFIREYDKAKFYSEQLIKIDPTLSDAHRSLIEIYAFQGNYDKAIAECDYELKHTKAIGKNLLVIKYVKA